MVRADLVDYIRKAEDRGLSVEQVKAILLKAGHSEEAIELAILETHKRSRVGRTMGFHPAILYFFILPVILVVVVVGFADWYGNGEVDGGVVNDKDVDSFQEIVKNPYSDLDLASYENAFEGKVHLCRDIDSYVLRKQCFEEIYPDNPYVYDGNPQTVIDKATELKAFGMCEQIPERDERINCLFSLKIYRQ